MTFEERLAKLGVEIRDFVPSDEHCKNLYDKFYAEAERICEKMSVELDAPFMVSLLLVAIAKRDIIIDRMETRLDNQTTLLKNLLHVIANADIPEDVTYEQFCLVVDSIYKAVQLAQEGWETYEAGIPKEWSVWEGESDNA